MWLALTTSDLILDVGSIAAVVVAIPLVWSGMRKWRETTTAPITLELSRSLWDDDRLSRSSCSMSETARIRRRSAARR